MIIDTHAHYDDEQFDEDRGEILGKMQDAGIGMIMDAGSTILSWDKIVKLTEEYPFVYGAIVPLEVIVRNVAAGSFSKRLGIEEGRKLLAPTLEFSYKDDDLGDPLINDYFAIAIGAATREEIDKITEYTFKVNDVLKKFFDEAGIDLIDFKIEFGRYHGDIILADEISPDTCRLWDKETHEKLDKDRFRRDMGNVEDAYQEVFKRIGIK